MQLPLKEIGCDSKVRTTGFEITDESIKMYYEHTEKDYLGGYYPMGSNTVWHGGVHIHVNQNSFIYPISSGKIVAARLGEIEIANKHYGSTNFILIKHEFKGKVYYCLYHHLNWEKMAPDNYKLGHYTWIVGKLYAINSAWVNDLKAGKIICPNVDVTPNDPVWSTGVYGSEKFSAPLVHWEIFSEELLLPELKTIVDTDNNFNCDNQHHKTLIPDFIDVNNNGNWEKQEIENYFADSQKCAHLREIACKFISEFSVDWNSAVKVLKGRYNILGLADRIFPYNFWNEANNAGAGLPADSHVWHYNPITFIKKLEACATIIIIVGTDAPDGSVHRHQNRDSFIKRVDRILNVMTVENLLLTDDDDIHVIASTGLADTDMAILNNYGGGRKKYSVFKKDAKQLIDHINSLSDVRFLIYFGHGSELGPMYNFGVEHLPKTNLFRRSSFKKNCVAYFATCNSKFYAANFARDVGVKSIGVEGTTFYDSEVIRAGKINPEAVDASSLGWEFTPVPGGAITSRSYSLSQSMGIPFLKEL